MNLNYAFDGILRLNFMLFSRVNFMLAKLWRAEFIKFLRFEFMLNKFSFFKFVPNAPAEFFGANSRRVLLAKLAPQGLC